MSKDVKNLDGTLGRGSKIGVEDLGGCEGLVDDLADVSLDHGELHHGLKDGMFLFPLFALRGKHADTRPADLQSAFRSLIAI